MNTFIRLAAPLLTLALAGCVATSPKWDERFGEAARTITAQQVIAPDASKNTDTVAGIDGKAAQGAMGEYAKSFTVQEKKTSTLNVNFKDASSK
ncbi:pilus assembly protein [Aromatoleum sp.]|uniref:pilus assembly protein n=1 Tax=Aromatoleum sp. TaxID=2307007 RepID=UPI002FC9BAE2